MNKEDKQKNKQIKINLKSDLREENNLKKSKSKNLKSSKKGNSI